MKRTLALIAVAATGALLLAGCGGDDKTSDADQDAITALVAELNRVTSEKDAAGFCDVIQPRDLTATFNTRGRCIKETKVILKQAGEQPNLAVDSIKVDGDTALVQFTGKTGEATLVKEDGKWYLPLGTSESDSSAEGDEPESGDEN